MADSFKLVIKDGKATIELNGVPIAHPIQSVKFEATAFGVQAHLGLLIPVNDVLIEADDCDVIITRAE